MANLNLNKVIFGGRVVKDIELKQTQSGISACDFTIAINRKNNQETDFFTCKAFKSNAEFISRYFHRGSSIVIIGQLQNRKWQDKSGNERTTTELLVDEAYFVDSKGEMQGQPQAQQMEELDDSDSLPF